MVQIEYFGYALFALLALLAIASMSAPFHRRKRLSFVLGAAILAAIALAASYLFSSGSSFYLLSIFRIYSFSMLFTGLFSILLLLVMVLSYNSSANFDSFFMMFGFAALGIIMVPMASSLIGLLLSLELASIPTIFMIAINGKRFIESSVKLLIMSGIAISILVFGMALIFPYDAQLSLVQISSASGLINGSYLTLLALVLFIGGLSIEAALFPFNLWVPDVYEGAPTNMSAMLSGINKKVALIAMMEISFAMFAAYSSTYITIFMVLSIFTMFFGNLAAMVQKSVKRLLAYSSISQAGYILVGFAAASQYGLEASIFQMITHSFMIIGAFAVIMFLENQGIKTIDEYRGMSSRNRYLSIALSLLLLSMAGVPPLMGFDGKFLLFTSAIKSNLLALAFIGILNSFISIYYYGKVIIAMYQPRKEERIIAPKAIIAVIFIALFVIIIFGMYPQPIIGIAGKAASALLGI